MKKNRKKPLVVVDAEWFINTLQVIMFQVPFEHYPALPGFDKVKKELLQAFEEDDNSSHRMTPDGRVLEEFEDRLLSQ